MNRIIGTVLCLAFTLGAPAMAQPLSPAAALLAAQPPATRAVLTRLDLLNHIPAEDWHIHVGDLPHGEDPALDDSAWPLVHKGNKSGFDSVWYRRWVEIPKSLNGYDLTGARIWFSFDASANGPMPEIFYYNGRRVALGEDLEPIVLTDHAVLGERILVAVKLQHTVDVKTFYGAGLRIDVAAPRPGPEDLRREFLTTAALVPSLSRSASADQALLRAAVAKVDMAALDAGDQVRFDASLTAAEQAMQPLKPMLQQATFYETGNAHIDAAWLWPWTETVDVVKRTFTTALQLMNEYPWYTFTQSAAAYNEWIATQIPGHQ